MSVLKECPECHGYGEVVTNPDAPSFAHKTLPCDACAGSGAVHDDGGDDE